VAAKFAMFLKDFENIKSRRVQYGWAVEAKVAI